MDDTDSRILCIQEETLLFCVESAKCAETKAANVRLCLIPRLPGGCRKSESVSERRRRKGPGHRCAEPPTFVVPVVPSPAYFRGGK